MKKLIVFISTVLSLSFAATAQNAREATVKYMKGDQNAVIAEYNAPVKVVAEALKNKMSKAGLGKSKSSKGFTTYSGTLWQEVSNDKVDVYYKVVAGKKNQPTTVQFLVSKGYDNFVSSATDATAVNNLKNFLNNLNDEIRLVQFGLDIKAQEEIVKKADEKNENNASEHKKLMKQKEEIEKKIVENENAQKLSQQELDREKAKLEEMKNSRP